PTNLYSFGAVFGDGQNPGVGAPVIAVDSMLYGTTEVGGTNNSRGTVFAISTNGTGYTILHEFGAPGDGSLPVASLTLIGSPLYGTPMQGGTNNNDGPIFALNPTGTVSPTPHEFGANGPDGEGPFGALTRVGSTLYGTTTAGGPGVFVGNGGTVFAINPDGS